MEELMERLVEGLVESPERADKSMQCNADTAVRPNHKDVVCISTPCMWGEL
jgi:hypothetical protein